MRAGTAFEGRRDAGEQLAELVRQHRRSDTSAGAVVLGLPRGGVPVAAEVATQLDLELDVFVVRKIGAPGHEELAMGAVASGGVVVRDESVIEGLGVADSTFEAALDRERTEVTAREERLGKTAIAPRVAGRDVIVVDDGAATGSTMRVAIAGLRRLHPERVIVALPVALGDSAATLRRLADEFYCLAEAPRLRGVGAAYADFTPTTEAEVRQLMQAARDRMSRGGG